MLAGPIILQYNQSDTTSMLTKPNTLTTRPKSGYLTKQIHQHDASSCIVYYTINLSHTLVRLPTGVDLLLPIKTIDGNMSSTNDPTHTDTVWRFTYRVFCVTGLKLFLNVSFKFKKCISPDITYIAMYKVILCNNLYQK